MHVSSSRNSVHFSGLLKVYSKAGLCNPFIRPAATTKVLSFVRPAISKIERSKTVKEFLITRAPNC